MFLQVFDATKIKRPKMSSLSCCLDSSSQSDNRHILLSWLFGTWIPTTTIVIKEKRTAIFCALIDYIWRGWVMSVIKQSKILWERMRISPKFWEFYHRFLSWPNQPNICKICKNAPWSFELLSTINTKDILNANNSEKLMGFFTIRYNRCHRNDL